MGEDPSAIREEIEETRARMGDTVDAIGYKTDVKARAKESVTGKVDGIRERISGAKDSVADSTPSTGDVKQGARRAAGVAQQNPIGLGVAALAGGFLLGMVIPSTRVEDEKIGDVATDVKERVKETAQEAVDRGKDVAQQAAQSAAETAKEQGQQQAQELKETAQQPAGFPQQSAS
jgi:phage tail protein X